MEEKIKDYLIKESIEILNEAEKEMQNKNIKHWVSFREMAWINGSSFKVKFCRLYKHSRKDRTNKKKIIKIYRKNL